MSTILHKIDTILLFLTVNVFGVSLVLSGGLFPSSYESKMVSSCIFDAHRDILIRLDSLSNCLSLCLLKESCSGASLVGRDCHVFSKYQRQPYRNSTICTHKELVWFRTQAFGQCPGDFASEFQGIKYKLFTEQRTHDAALSYCKSLQFRVHLADALSQDELAHLATMATGVAWTWLDGVQVPGSPEPAGGWIWPSANSPVNMSMFDSGQPDGGPGQDFIILSSSGKLHDTPAGAGTAAFICKCANIIT